ncbi:MAG: hypothetical protein AAFX94_23315 [Myxococcota bacterium]
MSFHQDIDELAQRLRDLHPRTFKYLTEADFDALLVETKAGLTRRYPDGNSTARRVPKWVQEQTRGL